MGSPRAPVSRSAVGPLAAAVLAVAAWGVGGASGAEDAPVPAASLLPAGEGSSAQPYRIVPDESLIAVVTLQAGIMTRMGHDLLIRPTRYLSLVEVDRARPRTSRFVLEFDAADLVVDDRVWKERVQGRLQELRIIEVPFDPITPADAEEIRRAMLAPGQLDAERHPRIRVESTGVRGGGIPPFAYEVDVLLTLRNVAQPATLQVRIEELPGGRLELEAHGSFHFTDFGIVPYRGPGGAVRNRNRFHLYAWLVLEPEGGAR